MANQFAARKDGDYKVISMAPDVCLTPIGSSQVPVPYPITIALNSSNNESQNVYFNGNPAFILSSDSVKTQGDEAGTGKGVKSGTKGAKAEPKDHSSSFKVNGSPVIRVNDQFYMNNKNTIGILVHCPPPPTDNIQDEGVVEPIETEELDFFEQLNQRLENALETASNKLNEAYNYAVELDEEYKIVTRAEGLVTGAFGVVEIVGGAAAIIFPEPATTAGGVLLVANGSDNAWSGFSQAWSGESQQTLLEKGVGKAANMMGVPEETAQLAMAGAAILSNPTKIVTKGDDVIETAWDIGKAQKKVDKIDAPKSNKATSNQGPKEKDASPKKEEGSDGGKVKGSKKVTKRRGDCAEHLVEQHMLAKGYKNLMIGDKKATDVLTNGSGHGLDHLMLDNSGNLVVAETKSNKAGLSKNQKQGGKKYLAMQIRDMQQGLKGKGRYKQFSHQPRETRNEITKALKSMKKAIEDKAVKSEYYQVPLEPDDDKDKKAYTPVNDKKRCRVKKGKNLVEREW